MNQNLISNSLFVQSHIDHFLKILNFSSASLFLKFHNSLLSGLSKLSFKSTLINSVAWSLSAAFPPFLTCLQLVRTFFLSTSMSILLTWGSTRWQTIKKSRTLSSNIPSRSLLLVINPSHKEREFTIVRWEFFSRNCYPTRHLLSLNDRFVSTDTKTFLTWIYILY